MARIASQPFACYDSMEEAKANTPAPQTKKDGTEATPFNLYQISLPRVDKTDGTEFEAREVFVWSRSPVLAIGQTYQHYGLTECVLAEKPDRTPVAPATRAKRAFAKLSDEERSALLAELMGSKPTNGDTAAESTGSKRRRH